MYKSLDAAHLKVNGKVKIYFDTERNRSLMLLYRTKRFHIMLVQTEWNFEPLP